MIVASTIVPARRRWPLRAKWALTRLKICSVPCISSASDAKDRGPVGKMRSIPLSCARRRRGEKGPTTKALGGGTQSAGDNRFRRFAHTMNGSQNPRKIAEVTRKDEKNDRSPPDTGFRGGGG
jgi:hypothetical protein